VYASLNRHWSVAVMSADQHDGMPRDISFVNCVATPRGGTHVNYIADTVARYIADHIMSKNKEMKVAPILVKNYMRVFVNAFIENPSFDTQVCYNSIGIINGWMVHACCVDQRIATNQPKGFRYPTKFTSIILTKG
jgi:hypothetical protein